MLTQSQNPIGTDVALVTREVQFNETTEINHDLSLLREDLTLAQTNSFEADHLWTRRGKIKQVTLRLESRVSYKERKVNKYKGILKRQY